MSNHDTQTHENENHLIGNILAEENSGILIRYCLIFNLDSDTDEP